jgi:hypothetical protein
MYTPYDIFLCSVFPELMQRCIDISERFNMHCDEKYLFIIFCLLFSIQLQTSTFHLELALDDWYFYQPICIVSILFRTLRAWVSHWGITYIHCTAGLGRAPAVTVGSHSLSITVSLCSDVPIGLHGLVSFRFS